MNEEKLYVSKHGFKTDKKTTKVMKNIRSKNTSAETLFRKELWNKSVRFRIHNNSIRGNPDIAIKKYKLAIFIDGDFWHGYDWDVRKCKLRRNREYWINKIEGNMKRDVIITKSLKMEGWTVLRFWEHNITKQCGQCVKLALKMINSKKIRK